MRSLLSIMLTVLAVLLLGVIVLTFFQRQLIYPRQGLTTLDQIKDLDGLEVWTIDTAQGEVEAFFLPTDWDTAAPAVVFAHGNGELIDYWPQRLAYYRALGFHVLLPEYRGYGRSAGSPSQEKITEDFERFVEKLGRDDRVDNEKIIYHGRSLGGGVVCALAVRRPPAALILESTFTSIVDIAKSMGLPGFLVKDPYDNLSLVSDFHEPILIMHGVRDSVIPFSHAQRLHQAASHAEFRAFESDHNDFPPNQDEYWSEISSFLTSL